MKYIVFMLSFSLIVALMTYEKHFFSYNYPYWIVEEKNHFLILEVDEAESSKENENIRWWISVFRALIITFSLFILFFGLILIVSLAWLKCDNILRNIIAFLLFWLALLFSFRSKS